MSDELKRGRRLLLLAFGLWLLLDAGVMAATVAREGLGELPRLLIRLLLTLGLGFWVARGSRFAKWLAVVLSSLASLLSGVAVVGMLMAPEKWGVVAPTLSAVFAVFCANIVALLVCSTSANAWLNRHQWVEA